MPQQGCTSLYKDKAAISKY